ncbi:Aste57867_20029 [Aphanomyces stellatus]|uniref:Aste57867_20029 protein n=1 Tax=Aphanomyces stellatus TaxID=120398 RepID=A0A485LF83_9STRA|nr:hypothetical protein As57867_019963 [Aphanomyces stellatus]VFT96725.1 Aste57867_20029 [Aphanomyces stellatus]
MGHRRKHGVIAQARLPQSPLVDIFSGEQNLTFPYYFSLCRQVPVVYRRHAPRRVLCHGRLSQLQGYFYAESLLGASLHIPVVHQFSLSDGIFDQQDAEPYSWFLPYISTTDCSINDQQSVIASTNCQSLYRLY